MKCFERNKSIKKQNTALKVSWVKGEERSRLKEGNADLIVKSCNELMFSWGVNCVNFYIPEIENRLIVWTFSDVYKNIIYCYSTLCSFDQVFKLFKRYSFKISISFSIINAEKAFYIWTLTVIEGECVFGAKKNHFLWSHLLCDCLYDVITTPTLLLHCIASCCIDARGELMVPNDEPPTDPRGVVKKDVEFAVSSSLSENRLKIKHQIKCMKSLKKWHIKSILPFHNSITEYDSSSRQSVA